MKVANLTEKVVLMTTDNEQLKDKHRKRELELQISIDELQSKLNFKEVSIAQKDRDLLTLSNEIDQKKRGKNLFFFF